MVCRFPARVAPVDGKTATLLHTFVARHQVDSGLHPVSPNRSASLDGLDLPACYFFPRALSCLASQQGRGDKVLSPAAPVDGEFSRPPHNSDALLQFGFPADPGSPGCSTSWLCPASR